ncbi:hypothetical protein CRUP_015323, partial [Coryphaenoides rupestris]
APLPKPRQKTRRDEEPSLPSTSGLPEKRESSKLPPIRKGVPGVTPLAPSAEEEDEDEEEVSQFSEGQLIPVSSQSYSDDSEMSEESIEEDIQAASSVVVGAQEEELSDSDDCVVPGQSSVGKK